MTRRHPLPAIPLALLAVALLALGVVGPAPHTAAAEGAPQPQPFAALTVTPAGRQVYDITSGVTHMPDGGTIVDQDTGVRLDATAIDYLAGASIDATGVSVEGGFGRIEADTLHIDIPSGTLSVPDTLRLVRDGLTLSAGGLRYDARTEIADFAGPVSADQPSFEAKRLLLDARTGDVVLLGPYTYHDGPIAMKSPDEGGRLQLSFRDVDGKPVYDAATQVSPELRQRFAGLLP